MASWMRCHLHAHAFLRKATLAHYCDKVMLPGLALASSGMLCSQKEQFRATVAMVADTLAAGQAKASARTRRISLLNENIGAHLRQRREERLGRWQGSLDVPARSVILSTALPGMREEFMSELLVLVLREAGLDARSYVLRLDAGPEDDPGADQLISTVFIAYPLESNIDAWAKVVTELRSALPDVLVVTIRPREAVAAGPAKVAAHVDLVLQSFEEALAFVAPRQPA